MTDKICPKCGRPTVKLVDFPLLDGSGGFRKTEVNVMCECKRKERDLELEMIKKRQDANRLHELRRLSLMDERTKDIRFSSYIVDDTNRKVFEIARKYVDRFDEMYKKNQGILFFGDVGTGKSYTAAAIANELLDRLVPVVMTSFVRILQELNCHGDEDSDMFNALNRAKLLVIDDLGAERGTDYALERVYDIIDGRYRSNRPVILTTNLQYRQMQECTDIRYNRIYDRIFEMCFPVRVEGKSWRKRGAMARFDEMKRILES